jgi:hypothetical protein
MQDDTNVDDILNGEITETPTASPAETRTAGEGNSVNQTGAENSSPEEASWSDLKGSTQDRIKQILKERNEERAVRERYETLLRTQTQGGQTETTTNTATPEVATAVQGLRSIGFPTSEDVDAKINQSLSGMVYNMELDRLESKYSGDDGKPKFDKDEYQDYISRHPQYRGYTPEDVYSKMYEEELFDWRIQHNSRSTTATRTTPSLRPTKTQVREEPLTRELIEQRLKEPDGRAWYDRNLEQVNAVLAKDSAE